MNESYTSRLYSLITSPQRCYIAGRYSRRAELSGYADELTARGHTVTSRWVYGPHEIAGKSSTREIIATWAREDYDDLRDAGWLIVNTDASSDYDGDGGTFVEFGLALAWAKRVVVVGPRANLFCHLTQVIHFDTWRDFAAAAMPEGVKLRQAGAS